MRFFICLYSHKEELERKPYGWYFASSLRKISGRVDEREINSHIVECIY